MAGTVGQGAQFLGNALIPETMARMQLPGLIEQAERKQQVGNIQAGRLLGGMNAEIGTPQTKSYQVNGRTIGQDNPSTVAPLFSPTKKMAMFSQAFPEQAKTYQAQQLGNALFPPKPTAQVLKPGETLGLTSADGQFTPTYTAPSEVKPLTPQSPLGKLESDYKAGLIDRATYEAAKRKENYIAPREERDTFGDQAKLRGEFDTKTKDFATTRDAYSRVVNVASNPSPAGDISLIFSFMKMNDPNSTVREGEYATAQNAGSVPQRVWGIYNKVLNGETLTPAQRADFVKQAGNLYGSQVNSFSQEYKRYSDLAQKYNFTPDKIVYDRTAGLPAAMPIPGEAGTAQAGQPPARPRATNPVTGEVVEWNGSEWAKVQ
jgi:hypothetical protein